MPKSSKSTKHTYPSEQLTDEHAASVREAQQRMRDFIDSSVKSDYQPNLEVFRYMMQTFHAIFVSVDKHLNTSGLTWAKLRMLTMIAVNQDDEGGVLPSKLSRIQGIMPNTVSSLLTSLREANLIEQIVHPQDGRKRMIRITPLGLKLLEEVGPTHWNFIGQLLPAFTNEERLTLIHLLTKITDNIQALNPQYDCPTTGKTPREEGRPT